MMSQTFPHLAAMAVELGADATFPEWTVVERRLWDFPTRGYWIDQPRGV